MMKTIKKVFKPKKSKNNKWLHKKSVGVFLKNHKQEISVSKIDKEATYSLDTVLVAIIRDYLREFSKYAKVSIPAEFYTANGAENGGEKWAALVLEIADMFDEYSIFSDDEKIKKGLQMLSECWGDLWW